MFPNEATTKCDYCGKEVPNSLIILDHGLVLCSECNKESEYDDESHLYEYYNDDDTEDFI